jgi:metal-responsive CopG/Arc/MetJ family transcriptional regulator
VKLSISLPEEDVALLDAFARQSGIRSRSAAVQHAVRLLRHVHLEQDYDQAFAEWESAGEHVAWDGTAADGLAGAQR